MFIWLSFFVSGLLIGSFLNVLIVRLKEAETLLGRSFCRNCKYKIRFYDNIPLVSFFLLRGACRDCGEKISWQYPLVEGLTGVLFLLVGLFFFFPNPQSILETGWLLGLVSILVALSFYDARHLEIPVSLLAGGLVWTLLFLAVSFFSFEQAIPFWETGLASGLAGGVLVAFFFFCLVWFSKETWMGWGDVWLGMVAGLAVGLGLSFFMLTLSFAVGAFVGMVTLFFLKKDLKTQIPFGPFLAFGIVGTLFLSEAAPHFLQFFFF